MEVLRDWGGGALSDVFRHKETANVTGGLKKGGFRGFLGWRWDHVLPLPPPLLGLQLLRTLL